MESGLKGNEFLLTGKLSQQEWEDKTSGQKRSKIILKADKAQYLMTEPKQDQQAKSTEQPVAQASVNLEDIPF